MARLTRIEKRAIIAALAQALAGPLDGYEDEPDEKQIEAAMASALDKLTREMDRWPPS